MATMFLNRAIAAATMKEMAADNNVILMGEDIINRGGGLSIFMGVAENFPDRCFDMPICESGYTHFSNGAAIAGLRPIVDLMFSDFAFIAGDAIVNNSAKFRFNSLGTINVPSVFVFGNGGRGTFGTAGSGSTHSQCSEAWFMNVPGLKIVAPYYAEDAYGLMRSCIRDNDPTVFFYHEGSLGVKSEVPDDEDFIIPLNNAAKIRSEGDDITIVAIQSMVPLADKAAEELRAEGISCEVIDPRVIIPFDEEKVIKSVNKTGHLLIVHEAPVRGGVGGEIATIVGEKCFTTLKAPIKRLGALNSPIPCNMAESLMMPNVEKIKAAVKEVLKK